MLMFISFPVIADECKDVLEDTFLRSITLSIRGVNLIFKAMPPVLIGLHQGFGVDALALGQDIA